MVNTSQVTIVVLFSIDENGKVGDIEVETPFHPVFDQAAEEVIRNSPPWYPALKNNRRVKMWFKQPLTFENSN